MLQKGLFVTIGRAMLGCATKESAAFSTMHKRAVAGPTSIGPWVAASIQ